MHHFSFLMYGLRGKGWQPEVNFWFDHQIVVGVPGKGCYVFYDRNQLSSSGKFKDVQESIDNNPNFVGDFKKKSEEIFRALFSQCEIIDSANFESLSESELLKMYRDFIKVVTVAPIITVQLWGIEACFDEKYKIISFLRTRLIELGKGREFENYKGLLQVNTGETVAFTEQKDLLSVATKIDQNAEFKDIFINRDVNSITQELERFPTENALIEKHIKDFEWVNTEYVSGDWTKEKWIELFKKAIAADISPQDKLIEHLKNSDEANAERIKVIKELNPPQDVLHAINALAIFIAERDWTKGYFTKILLSYHKLLDEIAKRIGTTRNELFNWSYKEVDEYLTSGKVVPKEEITDRLQNGFVIFSKNGGYDIITGKSNIDRIIKDEGISEPFEKVINIKEFKGLAASPGKVTGKVRVM